MRAAITQAAAVEHRQVDQTGGGQGDEDPTGDQSAGRQRDAEQQVQGDRAADDPGST